MVKSGAETKEIEQSMKIINKSLKKDEQSSKLNEMLERELHAKTIAENDIEKARDELIKTGISPSALTQIDKILKKEEQSSKNKQILEKEKKKYSSFREQVKSNKGKDQGCRCSIM